jgi:hypothetical protein
MTIQLIFRCPCCPVFFLLATRIGTAELWLEYIWKEVALSPEEKMLMLPILSTFIECGNRSDSQMGDSTLEFSP